MPLGTFVRQQAYHMPEACRQAIKAEEAQILHDRIIEELMSPWPSTIAVLV